MKRRSAFWIGLVVVPTLVLVGCGSDPQTTPDTTPPLAPQLSGATFDDGAVGVWWEPNTEPDLAGYFVYLIENGTARPANLAACANNYMVAQVESGAGPVQVYVTAIDVSGNESSPSETARAIDQNLDEIRPIATQRPQEL